jgi:hypothetical protein
MTPEKEQLTLCVRQMGERAGELGEKSIAVVLLALYGAIISDREADLAKINREFAITTLSQKIQEVFERIEKNGLDYTIDDTPDKI